MLVLSREQNERIVFPTLGITIEVFRINGRRVRLGIDAPREIPVLRGEIPLATEQWLPASPAPEESRLTHAARNRLQKATLGLRLVQKLIDSGHADNVEPTMCKIFNELKALEEELAPAPRPAPAPQRPEKHFRALVVEDDANESELLAGYLRLSGFEVDTASDGLQAMVRLSKDRPPDVVLLDMKMPRFDGRKTVSAIRDNPELQDMKIFAVTGMPPEEASVQAGARGVDRWFTKPVDPARLVDAFRAEQAREMATP